MNTRLAMLAAGLMATAVTHAQVPQSERSALLQIYQATGGDQWTHNDGWLGEPGTECDWYGVVCESVLGQPRVRGLHLSFNELQGRLPGYLGELSELERLLVAGNQLEGTVPTDLWDLEKLESLAIAGNAFTGAIPDELLALPGDRLDLSDNHFDGYLANNRPLPAGTKTRLILANNRLSTLPPPQWRQDVGFDRLDLSGNRLSGALDVSELPSDLIALDISNNRVTEITGLDALDAPDFRALQGSGNRLTDWPHALDDHPVETLDLSDNQLDAPLPEWLATLPLRVLEVSNNDVTGPLPASLSSLSLVLLDVSNNQITGDIGPAVDALTRDTGVYLDVSSNHLSGALPESIMDLRLVEADTASQLQAFIPNVVPFQPGLNLCWNDFTAPESTLATFIDQHHFAGSYTGCLQDRLAIGPGLSGSWFNPQRSGEGIIQHQLDNGRVLMFWFTFPLLQAPDGQTQQWFLRVAEPGEKTVHFDGVNLTEGTFGEGGTATFIEDFQLRTSRESDERQQFSYSFGYDTGGSPALRTFAVDSDQYNQVALTRLAGTTCDNQTDYQEFSGAWYDPERSGEGFVVEVLPDDRVVAYWFTYKPDGSGQQAWMIGDGAFDGPGTIITPTPDTEYSAELNMYQPVGTEFGDGFDPEAVQVKEWGTLTLTFLEGGGGRVEWDSILPEYGSGSYPIERLARPMLAECE